MGIILIRLMPVLRTGITDPAGLWAELSSAPGHGSTAFTAPAIIGRDSIAPVSMGAVGMAEGGTATVSTAVQVIRIVAALRELTVVADFVAEFGANFKAIR